MTLEQLYQAVDKAEAEHNYDECAWMAFLNCFKSA
jgi:hypothetical protein